MSPVCHSVNTDSGNSKTHSDLVNNGDCGERSVPESSDSQSQKGFVQNASFGFKPVLPKQKLPTIGQEIGSSGSGIPNGE